MVAEDSTCNRTSLALLCKEGQDAESQLMDFASHSCFRTKHWPVEVSLCHHGRDFERERKGQDPGQYNMTTLIHHAYPPYAPMEKEVF